MCGIVGAVSTSPVDRELMAEMRDRLAHRGPDAAGLWASEDGRVCLGHRRLSIVDLSPDANQPFLSPDGRHAITLNGEIYNFRALRAELEREGVRFRTRSDTEVLLEAYRRWGEACLDRLSGMFAFAVWDDERGVLFCARDRAGEKPFHYAVVGESFVFASELKALVLWPGFSRELDGTAIADYLSFGFVPDPKTVWRAARKLPPAHTLTVRLGEGSLEVGDPSPYWDLTFAPGGDPGDEGEPIRQALVDAAAEMSYADVPVGAFLSGGIDSSSVIAALAASGGEVHSFTVGFDDDDYDERPFAREVAARYGTQHVERTVHSGDVESVMRDTILWHVDEPLADHSYLPTYYVCREARGSITVALTGDGGDELFAGYPKYAMLARRRSVERALSRPVTQLVAAGAHSVLPSRGWRDRLGRYRQGEEQLLFGTLTTGLAPETLNSVARGPLADALASYEPSETVQTHLRAAPPAEVGLVNAMRYLDFKLTLGAGILTKLDRTAMAVSLETRPVYLNRTVLDVAARIRPESLADGRRPKTALRSALRPWLPSSVLDRPKRGFAMPLGRWLRGDLPWLADRAAHPRRVTELVDRDFAASLAATQSAGEADSTAALHSLLYLDLWLERWT